MTVENGDVVPRGVAVKTFVVGAVIGALLTTASQKNSPGSAPS